MPSSSGRVPRHLRMVSQHLWRGHVCSHGRFGEGDRCPQGCQQWGIGAGGAVSACIYCWAVRPLGGGYETAEGVRSALSPRCIARPPKWCPPFVEPPPTDELPTSSDDFPGRVYFIAAGPTVKIGWAVDPAKRVAALATANPVTLELLGSIPGTKRHERALHAAFGWLRLRGEWFRRSPALDAFIAEAMVAAGDEGRAA